MATNWSPADEIDVYNGNVLVAIIKVIVGNKISTKKSSDIPLSISPYPFRHASIYRTLVPTGPTADKANGPKLTHS
jgi:hypothetical protein